MKRFFIYCIVIIGTLFVGLMFYMFAKNNEIVEMTIPEGDTIYLNVGETFDLPINHTKADKRTTIEYKTADPEVVLIDSDKKKIEAKSGGSVVITMTPSNEKFGPFQFNVRVGDGTTENPYFISKTEQLLRIGKMESIWTVDDSYEVVANLDFKETWTDDVKKCWTPIGTEAKRFTGNFNGDSKTISNLYIDETCEANYVGLFGYVDEGAKVERISLLNPSIKTGAQYVGAIAGYSQGLISRCKVLTPSIEASSTTGYVGGIVGETLRGTSETEISMCQVEGGVINGKNVIAGIVAKTTSGIIANNKAYVTLADKSDFVAVKAAGIVGEVTAIAFTQNIGEAKTFTYKSHIQTNLSIPTFGRNESDDAYIATTVDPISVTDVTVEDGATAYIGNIFHVSDADLQISTKAALLSRNEIETQSKYVYVNASKTISWDFVGTWTFENKVESYSMGPYIVQDGAGQLVRPLRNGSEITLANAGDIFAQLMEATSTGANAQLPEYTYVITEDVEIDAGTEFPDGWTPIGSAEKPFAGSIYAKDAFSLTIKNIKIPFGKITASSESGSARDLTKYAGIFGYTSQTSDISGFNVEDLVISSDESTIVGGFVGSNNGIVSNIKITGICVKNGKTVGGIAGANYGNIMECIVEPSDTLSEIQEGKTDPVLLDTSLNASGKNTKSVGGIVGTNNSYISICTSEIIINATSANGSTFVGGCVGQNLASGEMRLLAKVGGTATAGGNGINLGGVVGNNSGRVDSCYSKLSSISAGKNGSSYAGGIAGYTGGTSSLITNSYFNGMIEGLYVGGLVGNLSGTVQQSYSEATIQTSTKIGGLAYRVASKVENCYFSATSQISFSDGDASNNDFAGFAVEFPKGGYISNCLTSATKGIAGNGNIYPETRDDIRNQISEWWDKVVNQKEYGTLNYNVVNSNGFGYRGIFETSAKILGWKQWGDDAWRFNTVDLSFDGVISAGVKSFFTSTVKFDPIIWDFSGTAPTLFGLNLDDQIEEVLEGSIIVSLATTGDNLSFDSATNTLSVTGFTESMNVGFNIYVEGVLGTVTPSIVIGTNVSLGTLSEGVLPVTITATGTTSINLVLSESGVEINSTITINVA